MVFQTEKALQDVGDGVDAAEKEKVQAELDEKMERWMYLTELNEKIEAQK